MAETRQQNPDDERLPGAVSNQNAEEQPSEAGDQPEGRRHPKGDRQDAGRNPGAAGEDSQSTGHPSNAG